MGEWSTNSENCRKSIIYSNQAIPENNKIAQPQYYIYGIFLTKCYRFQHQTLHGSVLHIWFKIKYVGWLEGFLLCYG